jgi:cell wall-associated NlpC family hydrolase
MDTNKFVGLVHHFGKSSFKDGADCVGLCRLYYRELGDNEDFFDGKPEDEQEYKHQHYRILRYLLKNLTRIPDINNLQRNDIVLLKIAGDNHMAISLDYGKILSASVPCIPSYSKSTIYKRNYWSQFFVAGFRSRKEVI